MSRELSCVAILFDLDGTLLDSFASANRAWSSWAAEAGLGDGFSLQGRAHGRQRPDLIAELLPHLTRVQVLLHAEVVRGRERDDLAGVTAIPGAAELLASLPPERWAVVTSGDNEVARARLRAAGLPAPGVFVSADDLDRGKPDPAGYLLGAARLGVAPEDCLVIEDAEAGLEAARRAGMPAIATRWTSPEEALGYAEFVVDDLRPVSVEILAGRMTVAVKARTA